MEADQDEEREFRAARNQAMFRAVNERLRQLNEAFAEGNGEFVIACECADPTCVQTLSIRRHEYEAVRANPRHFAVLAGHIYPDVETVVTENGGYVIVEKTREAAHVAEKLAGG